MSVMDKLINAMKMNDDPYDEDEYYDEEDLDDEEEDVEEKEPAPAPARPRQTRPARSEQPVRQSRSSGQGAASRNHRPARSMNEERTMPRDDYEENDNPAPVRRSSGGVQRRNPSAGQRSQSREAQAARNVKRTMTEAGMEVCVIKPTSVNDARDVTDNLLVGSTVVLNLEGLDVDIAQRIIDFTSGSTYAIRGNVMKISHYIFVITPANVDISGDVSATTNSGTPANLSSPFSKK